MFFIVELFGFKIWRGGEMLLEVRYIYIYRSGRDGVEMGSRVCCRDGL